MEKKAYRLPQPDPDNGTVIKRLEVAIALLRKAEFDLLAAMELLAAMKPYGCEEDCRAIDALIIVALQGAPSRLSYIEEDLDSDNEAPDQS